MWFVGAKIVEGLSAFFYWHVDSPPDGAPVSENTYGGRCLPKNW